MTEPDRIRRDIETTQRSLGSDVNALTEKVTPSRIVERRVDRMRTAVRTAKEKVMGSATDYASTAGDKTGSVASTVKDMASTAADQVSSAASSVTDSLGEAPEAIRRGTQGNPLAAGLIAFGAGWLVSSLLPASEPERRLASQATDLVREQVRPAAQEVAEDMKENLREPVKQAAESIKAGASEAASNVTDEARAAGDDVAYRAQEAQENVRSTGGR